MPDEPKETTIDIDLAAGKLRLENVNPYEDVRPVVVTSVEIVNDVLKVAENLIGLPADFLNHHLGRFRDHYRSGVEELPDENRQRPTFRLTCSVLREAAYAAEEPQLQDIFANLLLTGSDNRTFKKAHPGFANTINQLTWFDAGVLVQLRDNDWEIAFPNVLGCNDGESNVTGVVLTNLHRLGLIEWQHHGARSISPYQLASTFSRELRAGSRMFTHGDNVDLSRGLERATQRLTEDIAKGLEGMHTPIGIEATDYGKLFAAACLGTIPPMYKPESA